MRSLVSAVLLASASLFAWAAAADAATITMTCGSIGGTRELCAEGARAWARETGNEVEIVGVPQSSSEQLALYQQMLNAGAGDIDVMQVDIIWPGLLGDHFVDIKPHLHPAVLAAMFQPVVGISDERRVGTEVISTC